MNQQIDFLPASYHQRRLRRKGLIWRRGIMAFGLILVAGLAVQLWQQRVRVAHERDRVIANAQAMAAQLADPALLAERVRLLDTRAELLSRLQMHASPTRVLAAVTRTLPKFVSLTEYRTQHERMVSSRNSPPNKDTAATQEPAEQDLQSLIRLRDGLSLVVTLQGLAPHDVAISSYLAALQDTQFFDEVTLLYTDERSYGEHSLRTFGIRLHVRNPETSLPSRSDGQTLTASYEASGGDRP